MGVGGFPESHPLSLQWFGMHGAAYGNWAVDQCDLLLCVGASLQLVRVVGPRLHGVEDGALIYIPHLLQPSGHEHLRLPPGWERHRENESARGSTRGVASTSRR
jgi:hypothetical protein